MKNKNHVRDAISGLTTLPTLPTVASHLLRVVHDPNTSARDVAAYVSQDVALSARVLRLANSAFYGIPRSVSSLPQAVVILGIRTVTTIVLTLTVFDLFPQDKKKTLFDRAAFWRHSLACGILSRMLVPAMKRMVVFDSEEAFSAGLLHDIGKIVMEQYLHDDFRHALQYAQENRLWGYEAERVTLGYTHTEVAQWLTEQWDLPLVIRQPMIHHHHPEAAEENRDIISLCHYADWLCCDMGLSIGPRQASPVLRQECVDSLELEEKDVASAKERLPEELEGMATTLGL